MFERRLQEVRQRLEVSRLDALFISHLPHVRYLTDFTGSNGICIVTRRKQYFFTDSRYLDQAKAEIEGFEILISRDGLFEAVRKRSVLKGQRRVGFESQFVSVFAFNRLKGLFPATMFVPTRSVIEGIATIKDESEIKCIRRAAAISDNVFRKVLPVLKDGIAELDVAAEISYWHKRYGADGDAFNPIVASGVRGALPHARASAKKIKRGELVTLDFGCRLGGYNCDITRTVAVGRPINRARRIHRVVLDAQRKAIEAARGGMKARALDRIARRHIHEEGYGKYFCHSLGHGLGFELHEPLRLSAQSKDILIAGNVVTIEPGIYIPAFGGVRIEDDIVIRQNGCEVLTGAPKELIVL